MDRDRPYIPTARRQRMKALPSVRARAYLSSRGWREVPSPSPLGALYLQGEENILLPFTFFTADYFSRVAEMLDTLSRMEDQRDTLY